ncbi:LysE/ArgO family amino acid transporter [Candidatus Pseudothioglobus singularis]|uniref:Amino acid transporter n=1 Tax=Candidatus Pseudothioglobus singularis PS1 TaxID=1125411 RepID=A0A0M4LHJ9_9GAMM|nr:LysE family transporter [Candidatus Pseudothioglobus singularis]ALE02327.1 amino acid transporter [Candidatus Pseudothioglobus singularis PS1]
MISAFITGFLLGLSLIAAIGAQNTFVISQGISGKHVFYVALFCAIADGLLISIGVLGASSVLNKFITDFSNVIFGLASVWLFGYGVMKLKSSFQANKSLEIINSNSKSLKSTIGILVILTFANPHVYLDTMVLIGTYSQQFIGVKKFAFSIGAIFASFVFFFSLAYGAKKIAPIMRSSTSWQILDFIIALIMFSIAFNFASSIDW